MNSTADIFFSVFLLAVVLMCSHLTFYILHSFLNLRKEVWHSPKRISDKWASVDTLLKIDPALHSEFILEPKQYLRSNGVFGLFIVGKLALLTLTLLLVAYVALLGIMDLAAFQVSLESISSSLALGSIDKDIFVKLVIIIPPSLAVIVAAIQIRASLTAHNRKKWIEDFREAVEQTILNIPDQYKRDANYKKNCRPDQSPPTALFSEDNQARTRLELLINPTEPDHRVLSTLIRFAYGITDPAQLRDWYEQDKDQAPNISFLRKGLRPAGFEHIIIVDFLVYKEIKYLHTLLKEQEFCDQNYLVSLIFRLSNAILKREWERVKRGV
jgi:hypothetical protein